MFDVFHISIPNVSSSPKQIKPVFFVFDSLKIVDMAHQS